jgi:subtilisin family serine protease
MDFGMNPGLGVRKLHEGGITGKGVGIAIIDQELNAGHGQYADRLRLYELYHTRGGSASPHGPAVAGAAVGKDIGTAPGADLYYIANIFGHFAPPLFLLDLNLLADCVDRVLEMNEYIPEDRKIRVLSISRGFSEADNGGPELKAAINRANEAGVFVITTSPEINFNLNLMGLGRDPMAEPDDIRSYEAGGFWADAFYNGELVNAAGEMLLVPMDSRVLPAYGSEADYTFSRYGGLSWAVPWLAGMYALCAQVNPGITPEMFISLAMETGDSVEVSHEGKTYKLEKIINPARLIEAVGN